MEQKQICYGPVCDRLTPPSANYPWLVIRNLNAEDQIFYNIHDPLSHYRCRIPELLGREIEACFHGWVILSKLPHRLEWSLWNPVTSKFIRLPTLIVKDDIDHCCLSSPPDDPSSILLLMTKDKPNIVFCRLRHKRKRLRSWTEMSYAKQLKSITGQDKKVLFISICCNGKVYAMTILFDFVILVDIVVKDREVVISLLPFVNLPSSPGPFRSFRVFLKGSYTELFAILLVLNDTIEQEPCGVYLFKLDMTNRMWEEMEDLKDRVFFVGGANLCNYSILCSPAIASELGGYIHIIEDTDQVIYSYDIKDKTISLSSLPCRGAIPGSNIRIHFWAMPECRLQDDHGEAKCKADSMQEENKEDEIVVGSVTNDEIESNSMAKETQIQKMDAHLLNIPLHVLEMIMEHCVGVEYLNFRATCKHCHLAAPSLRWSKGTTLRRLQTYSLFSPWLMVFDKYRGIITFTDLLIGDKYFMKTSPELIGNRIICCSRYGWLLMFSGPTSMVFFNPFTSDIRKLPEAPVRPFEKWFSSVSSFCFSAPPTSPDCMVVGFTKDYVWGVCIYYLPLGPSWRIFDADFIGANPCTLRFPTFYGRDLYALSNEGGLHVFRDIYEALSWELVVAEAPRVGRKSFAEDFLVKCDQHLLMVIVGEFGKGVEVLRLNNSTKEWEKIDGLGRHMIYICGATCFCVTAKTPEMENKIYFPRFHSENEKIVLYSLETCKYHTLNGNKVEETFMDFFSTKQPMGSPVWIEPSWS